MSVRGAIPHGKIGDLATAITGVGGFEMLRDSVVGDRGRESKSEVTVKLPLNEFATSAGV